ncbi:MAG: glycosyltransferase family 2 protein [Bacteroidota bacterium]
MTTPAALPRVGVVTVNWNAAEDTLGCLDSLAQSAYPNLDIVVCDNASTDGSYERLKERMDVTVIQAGANLGWCGGVNLGAKVVLERGCDYLLILNNDTILPPELIPAMVAVYARDPKAGLVTARERLYHNPGRGDRLAARYRSLSCMVEWLFADDGNKQPLPSPLPAEIVSCCGTMAPRAVVEQVGILDEDYFIYWEDVDWSLRVWQAGYQNYCVTDSMIIHKSGASLSDSPGLSLPQLYLVCRGQAMLARKHARKLARVVAPARLLLSSLLTLLRGAVSPQHRPHMRTKLAAFADGWWLRPVNFSRLAPPR